MSDENATLPEIVEPNDPALWICFICSFAIVAGVSLSYKFIEPSSHYIDIKNHAICKFYLQHICFLSNQQLKKIYRISEDFGVAFVSVVFIPTSIASYIFTELSVSLVGCVYPIYRATKAVCTPGEDDDKEWLQYWMLGGVIFMLTTWVDDVIDAEKANDIWLGSALFLFAWLYFPLTQGSRLVYEKFTDPVLGPHLVSSILGVIVAHPFGFIHCNAISQILQTSETTSCTNEQFYIGSISNVGECYAFVCCMDNLYVFTRGIQKGCRDCCGDYIPFCQFRDGCCY